MRGRQEKHRYGYSLSSSSSRLLEKELSLRDEDTANTLYREQGTLIFAKG
jgi:hypothetical protein